jgi:hypothetical protein
MRLQIKTLPAAPEGCVRRMETVYPALDDRDQEHYTLDQCTGGTPNRLAFVTDATVHFTLSLYVTSTSRSCRRAQRAPSRDGKEANHAKSNVEGPSVRRSSR